MKKKLLFLATGLSLYAGLTAQDKTDRDTVYQIAPVTVTATYATERLSPVTFSNLDRQEIKQRYSNQDIPAFLSELPSTFFYSENGNGIGYNYINLRGFDQRRLSVMVNGVPQNDPEDHNIYWLDFPDLLGSTQNIQVQRGAGSAFYGPPAIGGSINLLAIPFHQHPGITLETSFGFQEYGSSNTVTLATRKFSATFNSGLVDKQYMFYGRLGKLLTDGYRDRAWVDVNSFFFGAARLDETMTTRVHFYGGPLSDGLVFKGLPKFYNKDVNLRRKNYNDLWLNSTLDTVAYATDRKPQEVEEFSQPHFEILHEWRLNPKITIFNTLFYIQGDGAFDYDGDWVAYPNDDGSPTASILWFRKYVGYDTTFGVSNFPSMLIRGFVGNKQLGWLPRIEITHDNGSLTLGAELRFHRSLHWGKIRYASNLPSSTYNPDFRFYEYNGEKDIVSIYGHELYKLQPDLTLMADLQIVYNRYAIANEIFLGNNFSIPYFFMNPRVGINYNINEELQVYSNIAYTSREPRLKNLYAAEDVFFGATPQFEAEVTAGTIRYNYDKPLAKAESLLDFEVGAAYRNEQVSLSANLFWMEFVDELIKSGRVDIFGQPVTGNADRTRHIGIESEARADLGYGFLISGSGAVSYNRLVSYSVVDSIVNGFEYRRHLDGNPIAGSPDMTANLRLAYKIQDLFGSIQAIYVGSFYTDNTKNELLKNDAYLVFNADASYIFPIGSKNELTVRGEIRNLFSTLYTMSGEGIEFFPAAERNYVVSFALRL